MAHQYNPQMAPDTEFAPGTLDHLAPGNAGRMLDPRRTPMRILRLKPETGTFVLEITDFEDRGAQWDLPFEDVSCFQFARDARSADAADVAVFEEAIRRFDQPLEVACDAAARERARARLAELRIEADEWLREWSRFIAEGATALPLTSRNGDPRLWIDLRAYMKARKLRDMEDAFAANYVSNPRSGEMVKGHAIVLAEMGFAPYHGTVVRDPAIFDGPLSRARRTEHILARMAFVQTVFERTGNADVMLYRGVGLDGALETRVPRTFVSASFSLDIARALFDPPGGTPRGVLYRQRTPASRLFMTYAETSQLNQAYKEAEAVLLASEDGGLF